MKTSRKPSAAAQKHAWDRAQALGYAAATSGAKNHYAPGSYCAVLFDLAKAKALEGKR